MPWDDRRRPGLPVGAGALQGEGCWRGGVGGVVESRGQIGRRGRNVEKSNLRRGVAADRWPSKGMFASRDSQLRAGTSRAAVGRGLEAQGQGAAGAGSESAAATRFESRR